MPYNKISEFYWCFGWQSYRSSCFGDNEGRPYRGRTRNKTWDVLAACSFNMLFTYIYVAFEGSAHDVIIWRHCLGDVN